ncbi:MAG: molybdopterin molybdotransferase MoeA [Campylobacteraceae bacterium]|jgi:molybdopterin molybdotransferase|nr:molybdopterin molybdotransferase MoeA [Campylobacteraceae bacterium]
MKVSYKEALEKLSQISNMCEDVVAKPLLSSLGFVLSEDLFCIRNLPPYSNSALDGYAVKYEDRGKKVKIKEEVLFAGVVTKETLKDGECFKIMTGAKIPDGADTIVRFENTKEENGYILIPENIKQGDAFRVKGEECKIGNLLIKKGIKINASHIALLSSQGINDVNVYKKAKVLVLSTGNELKEPCEKANEDELYNTNAYSIISLLKTFDIEADYGGIVKDNIEDIAKTFENAKSYDVILSSGGVSAGEADFTKEALKINGFSPFFTSINLKPGKPTIAGLMGKTLIISLPGNPLAAFLNTYTLAIPAIKVINKESSPFHTSIEAKNAKEFKVNSGRTNIVLGFYENGKFSVTDNGKISSGMVEPLLRSNAIAVLDENVEKIEESEDIGIFIFPFI